MKWVRKIFLSLAVLLGSAIAAAGLYLVLRGVDPAAAFRAPATSAAPRSLIYKEASGRPLEILFYPPARDIFRRAPLVIYVHGGSWKQGTHVLNEEDMEDVVRPLLECGMAVASVEYRLTDEAVRFPAHIDDVTDAVRYLTLHAGSLGVDKARFCMLGGSAGAHLSLLAAFASADYGSAADLAGVSYRIRCVVALSTPCDFVDLSCYRGDDLAEVQALLKDFLGCPYEEDPLLYASASPVNHLAKDGSIPVFMAHGVRDTVVPVIQADHYVEKAQAAGMKIEYIRVINGKHGLGSADGNPTVPTQPELLRSLILFLFRHLLA